MAVEDYVAVISDDHETDVRDLDVVKVIKIEGPLVDIMDTEGITDETAGEFAKADGIDLSQLVGIALKAAEFCYAAANRPSSGAYELPELEVLLIEAGLLDAEDVDRGLDDD